jgi:adenosylmethionine-8-amino-7-oxononanoate aminotransferase
MEGYSSTAGTRITKALHRCGIFSRPLGNVVYLICPPLASRQECTKLGAALAAVLEVDSSHDASDARDIA